MPVEIKEVIVHRVCAVPLVMYVRIFHVPHVYGTVDVGKKQNAGDDKVNYIHARFYRQCVIIEGKLMGYGICNGGGPVSVLFFLAGNIKKCLLLLWTKSKGCVWDKGQRNLIPHQSPLTTINHCVLNTHYKNVPFNLRFSLSFVGLRLKI